MVDKILITKKLQELDRYKAQLEKHKSLTVEQLENNLDLLWAVQHGLQLSIQVILDIGNHILSEAGISINEYADIFPALARIKVIPDHYAHAVKGMAGLRNLLVHEYTDIDEAVIVDLVNNRLGDFTSFSRHVLDYIGE